MISNKRLHFVYVPDVMFVDSKASDTFPGFSRHRITLIGKFPITIDRVISAPPEFAVHRGLTSPRNTLNKIVPHTHTQKVSIAELPHEVMVIILAVFCQ